MPVDLSGRVIFLASPGGMDAERRWVREEVALFNHLRFRGTGVVFVVTGYEDVPGTVNRPQAAINPLVEDADFMILLVGDQLGSPTTATAPFRTGIEEELSVALHCLEIDNAPMRDIMLGFRAHASSTLRRPTQALREVLEFKNAIEATKELFHVGSVASETDLRHTVQVQLEEWARPLGAKASRSCPALMAALDRSNRPTMAQPPHDDADTLVQWAEEQAGNGLNAVADSAFAKAIADNNPDHLRRYARFLQRTGQLERAVKVDQQALTLCVGRTTVEDVRLQADLLAHLAQLKRKLGDPRASKRLLDEAVKTARPYGGQITSTLGYILDQSGIAAARLGDLDGAKVAYSEAHDLRVAVGDERGRAQSLINLARVARVQGDTGQAVALLNEAIGILERGDETRVLANALATLGEAVGADDPVRARDLLTRSLRINERLDIPDGVSVASNGLARLALSVGDIGSASKHAERVLEVSTETGNREGTAIAHRLLGEIQLASGEPQAAVESFRNALDLASTQRDPAREAQARLGLTRSLAALEDRDGATENVKIGRAAAIRASDETLIAEFDRLADST
jgi:tetratricopeptide (TPR) repeat protein